MIKYAIFFKLMGHKNQQLNSSKMNTSASRKMKSFGIARALKCCFEKTLCPRTVKFRAVLYENACNPMVFRDWRVLRRKAPEKFAQFILEDASKRNTQKIYKQVIRVLHYF